jgi:adenosylcobinamide amidohydrolase
MKFQLSITIIGFILFVITIQSTSHHEGVSWNEEKKRWQVEIHFNGKNSKYYFDNELDAVKTRNRFYKKMGILPQNPEE